MNIDWQKINSLKTGANFYIPQTEKMYDSICKEIGREDDEIFDWYYDVKKGLDDLKEILEVSELPTGGVELEFVESHNDGTATFTFKASPEFDEMAAEFYGSERSDEVTKMYLENALDFGHGGEV